MTGFTYDVQRFDTWIGNNYTELLKYCKRYHILEDELHDTYLNCKQRIIKSGFTETYFKTYIIKSLRNLHINEGKKLNNKFFIDIDNEDYINTVEERLQDNDETEKDTAQYREETLYFSKMLFKYIDENTYTEEDKFIFRCYYLMPKRFTYAKLNVMTGIDKSKCTRIIKAIKKDLRENFLLWLKEKNNMII